MTTRPDNASGAGMETLKTLAWGYSDGHPQGTHLIALERQPHYRNEVELISRTDATALLAEKAQRIERLEALLKKFGRELEFEQRLYEAMNGEPDPAKERHLRLIDATLSQPHPHGG